MINQPSADKLFCIGVEFLQTFRRKAFGDDGADGCPKICAVHNPVVLMICNSATKVRFIIIAVASGVKYAKSGR